VFPYLILLKSDGLNHHLSDNIDIITMKCLA